MKLALVVLSLLSCFLAVIVPMSAVGIPDEVVVLSDLVDDQAFVTYTFTLDPQDCGEDVVLKIPVDSQVLSFYVPGVDASVSLEGNDAVLRFTDCPATPLYVFFKLRSSSAVTYSPGVLQYTLPSPLPVTMDHKILVPLGLDKEDVLSLFPEGGRIVDDVSTSVVWDGVQTEYFIVMIAHERPPSPVLLITGAIILVFLLATGVFFYHRLVVLPVRKKAAIDKLLARCTVLQEKERQIMTKIITVPGIYQHTLLREVQMTKSNGSKIISKLEFRGLVERKRLGKINALFPGPSLR